MKTKAFFRGLSWLVLLNLLIKPGWIFLIDRRVQNTVGHEAYGVYFALFNLTYVLLFLADAGLTNMLTQSVAAGIAINVRKLFRTKLLLLLLYASCCFFIAWITGVLQWEILFYLVLVQTLSSLFLFLRGLLTASQLFKTDAVFSVLDKALMLLLCIGPVYGFFTPINIPLFLQLQLLATLTSVCCLAIFCFRKGLFYSPTQRLKTVQVIKAASPFLLIVLLMATHYRLDGFLLERLHPNGATEAGIYATAYRLLDAGNMVGYLCASFLVPFIARHRQEKNTVAFVALTLRHGLLLMALGVATFAFVFAPWLQQVLYHTNNAYNSRVIALCVAALPAYYLTHVYGSVLTAFASFRLFIFILASAVATNCLLNVWLIPSLGAQGCCIAALISQYGCGLLLTFFASQRFLLPRATKWLALYVAFAALCLILFSSLQNGGMAVWIILAAACLLTVALAFTQRARMTRFIAALNS